MSQSKPHAFLHDACTGKHRVFYPDATDCADCRLAAVLVGFVPDGDEYAVLLTVRAKHLPRHAGQIAFAGGRRDDADENDVATALRETHEELGIAPQTWQIFGTLPPLRLPTGYCVTPVLAISEGLPEVVCQADEVAEVFSVPCTVALNTQSYVFEENVNRGHKMPVLYWQGHRIWGATAIVLYQLALHYRHFVKSNS